ncbi:MAG: hypothetical protein U0Y82_12985 [Thermoleophilia bacterium]
MALEPPGNTRPPTPSGGPAAPLARMVQRMGGAQREQRLIVRIAELERRIQRLEAQAATHRDHAAQLASRIRMVDAGLTRLQWVAAPGFEQLLVPPGGRVGLTDHAATRVVCSAGVGADAELLSVTGAAMAAFGWRWRWDVVLSAEDAQLPAPVRRLRLMRQLCDEYQWVLWLDPDVSLVDLSGDVMDHISPDSDLFVCAHPDDLPAFFRPVVLLRASDWARELLDRLVEAPDTQIAPSRFRELPAEWGWRPGLSAPRGPHVMLGGGGEVEARRGLAVERLALLRRSAADLPGPMAWPTHRSAFGPGDASAIPALLQARGLAGTLMVAGPAPAGFCERLRTALPMMEVVHQADPRPADNPVTHPVEAVWLLGAPTELALTQSLMEWWPLVRPGGVMIGHPYRELEDEGGAAAAPTLQWFFGRLGLHVHVTTADGPDATWMVAKPDEPVAAD